ncbi:hypothetical protein [Methylobacterium oryzihabitans]|uniref:Uncharacterized protein n=1 Tax=Methylobacterium oryzihabitans TaxID=2499852 RepID=A0A3S2VRA3_9HYPH|nr:hypothetical protein [Methylobacterium oryzihabitans]RVU15326.1 hypothetical protein EOE48_20045 [Methylobacterium oryzihabitans]
MRHLSLAAAGTLLVTALLGGTAALAQDASVTVFPPLYRDMARATQATRPQAELSTTPQPVRAPAEPVSGLSRKVAEVR